MHLLRNFKEISLSRMECIRKSPLYVNTKLTTNFGPVGNIMLL